MQAAVTNEIQSNSVGTSCIGGNRPGRETIFHDRELYHALLSRDYFSENPTFGREKFRRCFRMRRELFNYIVQSVSSYDPWFCQRTDAAGRMGLSTLQKCTAALKMLAYGLPADACDEYYRLGESTTSACLKRFVLAIRGCFEATYLRQPTRQDFDRQLEINAARGFPGMFDSLDCMHWTWKNSPVAWQGQF